MVTTAQKAALGGPSLHAIDVSGWQTILSAPVDLSFAPISVTRQGFTTSGVATTYTDTVYLTKRVRLPYPSNTTFTQHNVAQSEYIYAGDLAAGFVNNSTATVPLPNAAWVMPSRQLVGNSIYWEIIASHVGARSAQQVASVWVQATDGTNTTAWQKITTPVISPSGSYISDANPVEVFAGTLDITALNTGLITLSAQVFPWIGTGSSIQSTTNFSGLREFSPRYFYKSTALLATPPLAYVSSAGSDTLGVISTSSTVASASPFLTIGGILKKVNASITQADGLIVNVVNTVALGTVATTSSVAQLCAAVTVTRAPGVARTTAIVQIGSAASRTQLGTGNTLLSPLTEGAITFYDVTVQRTGASSITNSSFNSGAELRANFVQWWNINFDNGTQISSYLGGTPVSNDAMFGYAMINPPSTAAEGSVWGISALVEHRIFRGFTGAMNRASWQPYLVVGSTFTNIGQAALDPATPTGNDAGSMIHSTQFLQTTQNCVILNASGNAVTISRISIINNLNEWIGSNAAFACFQICNATGNTLGAVVHMNTFTGAGYGGRSNMFYDGFATTPADTDQTHKIASCKGTIHGQINMKGDVFVQNSTLVGYFPQEHGAGWAGAFSMFAANTASEGQSYPGLYANIGSSPSTLNDPMFTNYQGSTWNGTTITAGAGGGNYVLQAGSPARATLPQLLTLADLAGTLRIAGNQALGCYV